MAKRARVGLSRDISDTKQGNISPFSKGPGGKLQPGSAWGSLELQYLQVDFRSDCTLTDLIDPSPSLNPTGVVAKKLRAKLDKKWKEIKLLSPEERLGTFYGQLLDLKTIIQGPEKYDESTILATPPATPITELVYDGGEFEADEPSASGSSSSTCRSLLPLEYSDRSDSDLNSDAEDFDKSGHSTRLHLPNYQFTPTEEPNLARFALSMNLSDVIPEAREPRSTSYSSIPPSRRVTTEDSMSRSLDW